MIDTKPEPRKLSKHDVLTTVDGIWYIVRRVGNQYWLCVPHRPEAEPSIVQALPVAGPFDAVAYGRLAGDPYAKAVQAAIRDADGPPNQGVG